MLYEDPRHMGLFRSFSMTKSGNEKPIVIKAIHSSIRQALVGVIKERVEVNKYRAK